MQMYHEREDRDFELKKFTARRFAICIHSDGMSDESHDAPTRWRIQD